MKPKKTWPKTTKKQLLLLNVQLFWHLKQKLIERGMNLALGCKYAVIVHESFFL